MGAAAQAGRQVGHAFHAGGAWSWHGTQWCPSLLAHGGLSIVFSACCERLASPPFPLPCPLFLWPPLRPSSSCSTLCPAPGSPAVWLKCAAPSRTFLLDLLESILLQRWRVFQLLPQLTVALRQEVGAVLGQGGPACQGRWGGARARGGEGSGDWGTCGKSGTLCLQGAAADGPK